jgi:tetratricopeptide (TPR) repeat protein
MHSILRELSEPILIGREKELKELQTCLDLAISGQGTTVFLSGEAGTGKTRIINEFLALIEDDKVLLLSGWCLSNSAVPYFPFIEAFDSYLARKEKRSDTVSVTLEESKAWLMGLNQVGRTEVEHVAPQTWKDQTFAAVAKELVSLSSVKPVLIVLEDMHWADSASALLLNYISRVIRSARVLILVTFRSEELNFDYEGHPHPIAELHRLMKRGELVKEISLSNLSEFEVGKVAENMLGGRVNSDLVSRLAGESQGNPLFVVESLKMLNKNRSLVQDEGEWRLSVDNFGIPSKVKDIILQRLFVLKSHERRVLDLASVVGDKFNPKLLGDVLDQDCLLVLETLSSIMRATSIVCVEGDDYWFDHAKSREVLYEEIPLPLRLGYHERLAEKIEGVSQTGGRLPFSDLAYHYLKAGNKAKAIKYALAAGQDALSKFSNTEAARYFTYVLDTVQSEPEYIDERVIALEGLGDSFHARSLFEEATATFERLSNFATGGCVKLRALRKAVVSSRWRGDLMHSLELAERARDFASFDRLEYSRIRTHKGIITGLRGNWVEGLADLEEARHVFEESNALPDLGNVLIEAASFYASGVQVDKALFAVTRSLALSEGSNDYREQAETYFIAGNVFFNCRLYREALDCYKKAIHAGEIIGDYNKIAWAHMYSGVLLESIGDFKAAIAETSIAKELSEKTDAFYIQSMAYANLTIQYSRIDDLTNAQECFEKFMKFFPEISKTGSKVAKAAGVRTKAVFLAAQNHFGEAYALFEECLELHKSTLYPVLYETIARTEYAWALAKEGCLVDAKFQTEIVKKLYEELDQGLEQCVVQVELWAPKKIAVGDEFDFRLEVINSTKRAIVITGVDNLFPPEFKATSLSDNLKFTESAVEINPRKLEPFRVEQIKLSVKGTTTGLFNLNPKVTYVDWKGKNRVCMPKPTKMLVKSVSVGVGQEEIALGHEAEFEFKTEGASLAFRFLIGAFVEDYMQRRLPVEVSGWRTLMDVVKHGGVSRRMVYGDGGYHGRAVSELERRGLVEMRVFPGERGRGGRILKLRVFYEKETVRKRIDDRVMRVGKK